MRRLALCAMVCFLLLLLVPTVASAQTDPTGNCSSTLVWIPSVDRCVTPADAAARGLTVQNGVVIETSAGSANQQKECPDGTAKDKSGKCELVLPDPSLFTAQIPRIDKDSLWGGALRVFAVILGLFGAGSICVGIWKVAHLGHEMMSGKATGMAALVRVGYIVGGLSVVILTLTGTTYRIMVAIWTAFHTTF